MAAAAPAGAVYTLAAGAAAWTPPPVCDTAVTAASATHNGTGISFSLFVVASSTALHPCLSLSLSMLRHHRQYSHHQAVSITTSHLSVSNVDAATSSSSSPNTTPHPPPPPPRPSSPPAPPRFHSLSPTGDAIPSASVVPQSPSCADVHACKEQCAQRKGSFSGQGNTTGIATFIPVPCQLLTVLRFRYDLVRVFLSTMTKRIFPLKKTSGNSFLCIRTRVMHYLSSKCGREARPLTTKHKIT